MSTRLRIYLTEHLNNRSVKTLPPIKYNNIHKKS